MKDYPLIKKWLGLKISWDHWDKKIVNLVDADALEAKLAEGFEIYGTEDSDFGIVAFPHDTQVALAIGKQPIKKQTQADGIKELLNDLKFHRNSGIDCEYLEKKLNKILEMKDE